MAKKRSTTKTKTKTLTRAPKRKASTSAQPGLWERLSPETRTLIARSALWVVILTVLIALGGWGAGKMEAYVLSDAGAETVEPSYRLANPPRHLSYSSRQAIGASFKVPGGSFGDPMLLTAVHDRVAQNPWVRGINQISKHLDAESQRGIVRIDCEFRRPVAVVLINPGARNQQTGYLSDDGVLLPAKDVPKYVAIVRGEDGRGVRKLYADRVHIPAELAYGSIHYPAIVGPREGAPAVGERWGGRDVADAISLIRLLSNKPYFDQIDKIVVAGHASRGDLTICAGQTTIEFGRLPIDADDLAIVWPDRKLAELDRIVAESDGQLADTYQRIRLQFDPARVIID